MKLEIRGKLLQVDMTTGQSKKSEWKKYDVLIEEESGTKLLATFFGDKYSHLTGIELYTDVEITAYLESKEYNGRSFTNLSGTFIKYNAGFKPTPKAKNNEDFTNAVGKVQVMIDTLNDGTDDGLPF